MNAHQWKMQTVINRDTEREEEMKKRRTEREIAQQCLLVDKPDISGTGSADPE